MTDSTYPKPDWEAFGKDVMQYWGAEDFHAPDEDDLQDLALKHNLIYSVPDGFNPLVDVDIHGGVEIGDPWFKLNYPRE